MPNLKTSLSSTLYWSQVRHRRYQPKAHSFEYRVLHFFLDLSEIERIFRFPLLMSTGRWSLLQFRRSDYLGDPKVPLDVCVRERMNRELGFAPTGPIRMLTQIRTFGFCFNPVTFYYCYSSDDQRPEVVVAEITNTPWNERHAYVLRCNDQGVVDRAEFEKAFHVSPFMPMQMDYQWDFSVPKQTLRVHMQNRDPSSRALVFDATVMAERHPLTVGQVVRSVLTFPLLTLKAFLAIHYEALWLWLKGVPVHTHPGGKTP